MKDFTFLRIMINLVRNAAIWVKTVKDPSISVRITPAIRESNRNVLDALPNRCRRQWPRHRARRYRSGLGARLHPQRRRWGSGLGLHVVKTAVQEAVANVRVWSRPFVATTFRLRIPAEFRVN